MVVGSGRVGWCEIPGRCGASTARTRIGASQTLGYGAPVSRVCAFDLKLNEGRDQNDEIEYSTRQI